MMFDQIFYFFINIIPLYFTGAGLLVAIKYLRAFKRSQTLKFTQEAVRSVSKEIKEFYIRYDRNEQRSEKFNIRSSDETLWEKMDPEYMDGRNPRVRIDCVSIMTLCNELAVGISEGLYDERYVHLVLGYQMLDFYKEYYGTIMRTTGEWDRLNRFMALELLLSKWASDDFVADSINKRRKYR